MRSSHWGSTVPAGSGLQAAQFLPTSAAAPFPSAHLGKPQIALHSAAHAVFFIFGRGHLFLPENSLFPAKIEFPLNSATDDSLPHSKQELQKEFLARAKSPAFYYDSCVNYLCSLFRSLVTHWSST